MAAAFGVRLLGTALVVIPGFYRFPRRRTRVGFISDHCRRIELDYQSGSDQPHSKGSADLIDARASINSFGKRRNLDSLRYSRRVARYF